MKLQKISLFIIMLAIIGGNSAHADLTCTLNRSITGASVSGTLTVNTIGTVAAANITAWDITVTVNLSTGNITQSNSTLDLGSNPPTITSTANSLIITPIPSANLTSTQASSFYLFRGDYFVQYSLKNSNGRNGPRTTETFIPAGTSSADQIYNMTGPASLNLTCTCAVGGGVTSCSSGSPVSAPIDLKMNNEVETYSEEISIK